MPVIHNSTPRYRAIVYLAFSIATLMLVFGILGRSWVLTVVGLLSLIFSIVFWRRSRAKLPTGANVLVGYRIIFALLGFSAIVTEIATLSERGSFNPANFFSFFTIESNLVAVAILILSALALASGKQGKSIAVLRGANTLNMIVVGIVFTLLLSGLDVKLTAVPWDNTVLHYIIPIVVALDWFIDTPKVRIAFKQALVWMVFPLAYVVYSLIRGYFVGWYPYPFLNPSENGYAKVAVTCLMIALGGVVLTRVLARLTQRNSP